MKSREPKYETLFFRICMGIATDEEIEQGKRLTISSRTALDEFERVKEAADVKKQIEELESCDVQTAFRRLQRTIRNRERRRLAFSYLSRAAAILFLPLLLSVGILGFLLRHQSINHSAVYAQIAAPSASVTSFELPDKSRIWLNAGSTLRYPNPFDGNTREVELNGEGYFEVHADLQHPFHVIAGGGIIIKAHGTKFGVRTDENCIETVLAEGCVAIFKTDRMLAELKKGDLARYEKMTGALRVDSINVYEKLAWKDGIILFRDAPLEEVFRRLERQYNVEIVLHDPYNQSGHYRSRVTFSGETIEQIMSYIQLAAPIEWKISNSTKNEDATLTKQRIDVTLNKKPSEH